MPPTMHALFATHAPLCHAHPFHHACSNVDRMTDACENITFPQLLLRTVITYTIDSKNNIVQQQCIAVGYLLLTSVATT